MRYVGEEERRGRKGGEDTETLLEVCRDVTMNLVLRRVVNGDLDLVVKANVCSYDVWGGGEEGEEEGGTLSLLFVYSFYFFIGGQIINYLLKRFIQCLYNVHTIFTGVFYHHLSLSLFCILLSPAYFFASFFDNKVLSRHPSPPYQCPFLSTPLTNYFLQWVHYLLIFCSTPQKPHIIVIPSILSWAYIEPFIWH